MSIVESTDELYMLAEQISRIKRDPRRPGPLDSALLSVAIGSGVVVGICLVILTFASDRYPVDPGRIVLTMAASGICVTLILTFMYGVNRANRKRHEALVEEIKQGRCGCLGGADVDPKDLAMRSFETGRRIGRREADG